MSVALIVPDMLNSYEHEDAEPLMESVREMLPNLSSLIARARDQDVLTVYVNDNHGDWSAGRRELSERAMRGADPSLIEPILPAPDLPFVVKARHSAFYETQLEYLLQPTRDRATRHRRPGHRAVLLYSSLEAYVRHFEVRAQLVGSDQALVARNDR
jgi:nicotinamidase-related amidase